jgi:hypothetical protein
MKRFSKRSVVLLAGVMAVCALAVPSMTSAATWGPVGGGHQVLTSFEIFVTTDPIGIGWTCSTTEITTTVTATRLDITSATFDRCTGLGATVNCTVTPVAQRLPWTATPTTPVAIDGVHVSVSFEQKPNQANCAAPGLLSTLTGNLGGGVFNDTSHEIVFTNATGLTSHAGGASSPATVTGTLADNVTPFLTLT